MQYPDNVTVYANHTVNEYNEEEWSSNEEYQCRFVEKSIKTLTDKGESVLADGIVHFKSPFPDLSVGDRIDYESSQYIIMEINKPKDSIGRVRFFSCKVKLRV